MISLDNKYTGSDLALLIPTKDRPEKMKNLLESLAVQDVICGRIIVVASGQSIEGIVLSFCDRLPVEYYYCDTPGQIRQRNLAISKLDDRTPLVGSLDDDLVVEDGAISAMIDFWNRCEPETAGVAFNIVNVPVYRFSWLKAMIGMSSREQARVLRSGYNVAGSPVEHDIRAQWLCGGATVWRTDILLAHQHKEIASRWAICEDVLFSYPIGKKYPLYVCAKARVRHEHVYDHAVRMKYRYYGRTITLWRLYFVEAHQELSRLAYIWMISWQIIARLGAGVFLLRPSELQYALGQVEGLFAGLAAVSRGSNLLDLLEDGGAGKRVKD